MNSKRLGLVFLCFGVFLLCQGVGFADDKLRTEIMSKGLKGERFRIVGIKRRVGNWP